MSVILCQAPLRVSLGGGGTDLPDYWREHGGYLVAGAIDKRVYLLIHTVFQQRWKMKYSETEDVAEKADIRHAILREALSRHWNGPPLEVASVADVPAGTGLGSSGAFTVALLGGLAAARRVSLPPGTIAEDASRIEATLGGGKQDPYASAFGGIAAYSFHPDGTVDIEPLELDEGFREELRERLLLFYTGGTRQAENLLRAQAADVERLHRAKEIGHWARDYLLDGDLESFGALMDESWALKREASSRAVELRSALQGEMGSKLVGAGGVGFLMVLARDRERVRHAMAAAKAPELRFQFDYGGVGAEVR